MDIKNNVIRLLTDGLISRVNDQSLDRDGNVVITIEERNRYDNKLNEIRRRIKQMGASNILTDEIIDTMYDIYISERTTGIFSKITIEKHIEDLFQEMKPKIEKSINGY